jgi:hypothetical protein
MSDPILLWNLVALEANRVSHTNGLGEQAGPPLSARALAIVHLAMYDAAAGIVNDAAQLPYYLTPPPTPVLVDTTDEMAFKAALAEAVAAAAHRTLCVLFPSQRAYFDVVLASGGCPDHGAGSPHAFGLEVADAILAERDGDPGAGSATYKAPVDRPHHRPDPDNAGQGFHAPDYGKLARGFATSERYELAPPPYGNEEYRTALKEVLGKGIKPELMGTLPAGVVPRTQNETVIGIYWGYDGAAGLGTPPRLYNQIVREIATRRSPGNAATANTPVQNARLFALVNVAMADAGILSWDQKYKHEFWRPVLGVREHDTSMGPEAPDADNQIDPYCDPLWLPLGAPLTNKIGKNFTPPFPAYPSGHATFGAAALHAARLFYGDGGNFSLTSNTLAGDSLFDGLDFVSEEFNGVSTDNTGAVRPKHRRNFPDGGLWQMIEENGRSRVYLGVHWVFDAFVVDAEDGTPDLTRTEDVDGKPAPFGGVPLGLLIAENIFARSGSEDWSQGAFQARPEMTATAPTRSATHSSSYPTSSPLK